MQAYVRCAATGCWTGSLRFLADIPICDKHVHLLLGELAGADFGPAPLAEWSHVVYYVTERDSVEHVKIGTTSDIHERMRKLGNPRLLVLEPGSYQTEKKRHRKFSRFRAFGEWFRYDSALVSHIDWTRREHPLWRQIAKVGYQYD